MAKDLPYFKFFVSEWSDGDVTLESYNDQGVFINVCSYYWSNGCIVDLTKLRKKFKGCNESIDALIECKVIKVIDGLVSISFLNEQLEERSTTSKNNSKAGKASAEAKRIAKLEREANKDSTPVENTLNGNPTNKKREEEIRGDKNNTPTKVDGFDWDKLLLEINKTFGREFRVINKSVRAKYNARLKDGYKKIDVLNAITNVKGNKFHIDNNYEHCTPEYFSRAATLDLHNGSTDSKKPYNAHS